MKSISILLSVTLIMGCAGTLTTAEKDFEYQQVYEVSGGKDTLFSKSLQWLAQTYTDSKEVIEYEDKEAGKIIGRGATQVMYNPLGISPIMLNIRYSIKIDLKDNKARITFTNIYNPQSPAAPIFVDTRDRLIPKFEMLTEDYHKFLTSDDDNW